MAEGGGSHGLDPTADATPNAIWVEWVGCWRTVGGMVGRLGG